MQGNIRVRKEFPAINNNIGYVSAQLTFSEESFSDVMGPNRAPQDSYSMLDLKAGITNDEFTAEIYINNATDERAEISNTFVFDRQRVAVAPPTTVGIRVKKQF